VALAQALASIFPLDDTDVLELTLFRDYFDSLIEHAKKFFRSVLDELDGCDAQELRRQIHNEETRINWNAIYAEERNRIESREVHDYAELIEEVRYWEDRTQKPEQSTPHLYMAYYHAMQVREKFMRLLQGIKNNLPAAEVSVAPLKLPYRALEKMALERSERRWTAYCVTDLARGAFNCADTRNMTLALRYLGACTPEIREDNRPNIYKGRVANLPEIKIMRMENRFSQPTRSGWADIFINFVFTGDRDNHVHELQIQHSGLVYVRKQLGEDSHYAGLRVLAELLQTAELTEEEETKD
jgi:hypothetical protein